MLEEPEDVDEAVVLSDVVTSSVEETKLVVPEVASVTDVTVVGSSVSTVVSVVGSAVEVASVVSSEEMGLDEGVVVEFSSELVLVGVVVVDSVGSPVVLMTVLDASSTGNEEGRSIKLPQLPAQEMP